MPCRNERLDEEDHLELGYSSLADPPPSAPRRAFRIEDMPSDRAFSLRRAGRSSSEEWPSSVFRILCRWLFAQVR